MPRIAERSELKRIGRYALGGLSTTLLNIILFKVFSSAVADYRAANLAAIVLTKIYGYLISKTFVFRSHGLTRPRLLREIGTYIAARGFTGLVDFFGLILLVSAMKTPPFYAKIVVQGAVIALNYLLGRHVVFRGSLG